MLKYSRNLGAVDYILIPGNLNVTLLTEDEANNWYFSHPGPRNYIVDHHHHLEFGFGFLATLFSDGWCAPANGAASVTVPNDRRGFL